MPGTTTYFALPYPLDGDPIDVAGDIKRLADGTDADLRTLDTTVMKKAGGTFTGAIVGTSITMSGNAVIGGTIAADAATLGLSAAGSTATPLTLVGPVGACYIRYYAEGNATVRSAYLGFGHNNTSFYLTNERANGSVYFSADGAHIFQTGATLTEKARVGTAGDFLVGKTTAGALNDGCELRQNGMIVSHVSAYTGDHVNSTRNLWLSRLPTANRNDQYFVTFRSGTSGTTEIGKISQYGTGAVAYQQTSDYRLKEDLGPIPDAATRLNLLQPKRVRWLATGFEADGFLAHEVTPAVPEAVDGAKDAVTGDPPLAEVPILDEDGNPTGETEMIPDPMYPPAGQIEPQQLAMSQLVPLIVAALKEALARIAVLEAA